MAAPPPPSTPTAASSSAAAARADRLAALRALPPAHYIAMCTAEAAMAGAVFSPAMLALYTLDGAVYARNPPPPAPGAPSPPGRPTTFGGLLAAGLRSGASMTARTVVWAAGTAAVSAAGRERARLGPRFVDGPAATGAPELALLHGAAGALTGWGLTVDFRMAPPRRLLYTALAGVGGVALPAVLATAGPFVRAQLGAMGAGGR